jgi:hypothetical protein
MPTASSTVDDILMIHHDGIKALREIDHFFKTKPNSIGDPEFYLGAKLQPITLPNGVIAWGMSASKYDQAAVAIVKAYHSKIFRRGSGESALIRPFPDQLCTRARHDQALGP